MTHRLWGPSSQQIAATEIHALCTELGLEKTFDALHDWSIADSERFWKTVWDRYGIVGETGDRILEEGSLFRQARFFPDAHLNVAENLLTSTVVEPNTHEAITFSNETGRCSSTTLSELRDEVSVLQQAMIRSGVQPGDVVAAWLPNIPATVAIFLAANAIGAIFTSSSPDFGTKGVVDRFSQLDPKLLFATDAYLYAGKEHSTVERLEEISQQLPTVSKTILVPYLHPDVRVAETESLPLFVAGLEATAVTFARQPYDHPAFVLFSSGTTGAPKGIVHRAGGVLLKLVSEHRIHCDIKPGDRVFYYTTAGWMMWNWLAMALASEATIILYDGSPFHPTASVLFDLVDREKPTLFGVSAKYVDALNKGNMRPAETHDLASVRTICSTGSTLTHESFAYLYEHVKADVHVASMSGGTDLCGCLVAGDPTAPVIAGEIQAPAIGLDIAVFSEAGERLGVGEQGELVCVSPFPSIPLRFLADEDNSRFDAAYFDRFPGVWRQGDFAEWSIGGGMIISGRSDATLNPGGVRIGTAEIYRLVEGLDEIVEGLVIGQTWDNDTRIVLFVRLADGSVLDDALVSRIKSTLRDGATPRHVPAVILAVDDIPRTRSGKISELAVRDVVHGRAVRNTEALANPEALDLYANLPELRASQASAQQ